jgi:hypothetical protein
MGQERKQRGVMCAAICGVAGSTLLAARTLRISLLSFGVW